MINSFLKTILPGSFRLLLFTIMMYSCNNNKTSSAMQASKLFVANEDGGSISVLDLSVSTKNTTIDLSVGSAMYMAHNVQVSPNGLTVWASANPKDSTK